MILHTRICKGSNAGVLNEFIILLLVLSSAVLRHTTICFLATRNHYLFQTDTCSALIVAAGDFVRF